ncbi:YdhK family protein [Piscibacillus sp. B03]|uniref:YdhK family protein n=1 Tax=Piscibacillus TaxID=420644 RepID=UPI001588D558|nr:YdhK family protein [Piscibacillus halophilus]
MKKLVLMFLLLAAIFLSACSNAVDDKEEEHDSSESNTEEVEDEEGSHEESEGGEHSGMNMSSSGEVPEGLEEDENPTFEVGSQAIIEADHMEGMNGAEATISGAYKTTVYTVSYTPSNGDEEVSNHKWVIHEELEGVGDDSLEPGDEVTLNAEHMEGMDGAKAEIDSAIETTVYMVDFTLTSTGEEVTNHKWVTEEELSSPEE